VRDDRAVVNRQERVQWSHRAASRVDSVEEQVIRRITHHEVHRAPAEQIVDRPAADNHRLRQWTERGPDRSVAGLRTLYDTTVGDWDGHTGRPLEMDARIRQRMPSRVEHVHWHLHGALVVHDDRVGDSRDEAR